MSGQGSGSSSARERQRRYQVMRSYVEAASIINEYLPTQNYELENRLFDALADVADLLREYRVKDIKAPRYRGHNSAAPYFDKIKLAVIDYVEPEIWAEEQAKFARRRARA